MRIDRADFQDILQVETLKSLIRSKRAPVVLAGTLVLMCFWFLWLTAYALIKPAPVISALPDNSVSNSGLRANWFSVARKETAPEPDQDPENLARASVRAELLGVLISDEGAYAAISTPGKSDGVYGLGDSIENNVTLEAVEQDRVIISQRGSRRQIPLKSLEQGGNRDQALIQLNESEASATGGFNLSGLVSTTPIQVPGGGIGLRLTNLSEDLTDLADVEEGDVILAVNGTAISDMMTNPVLWQQFSQQTNMPATVLRQGEEIELFINAASLAERILPRLGAGQVQQ